MGDDERTPADDEADDDGQRQFDSLRLGLGQTVYRRQLGVRRRHRTGPVSGGPVALHGGHGARRRARPLAVRRAAADDDYGAGRGRGRRRRRTGRERRRGGGSPPHHRADADVDDGEQRQRNDVDGRREPRDVERQRPVGPEVAPAVVDAGAGRFELDKVEDDELRNGEERRGEPGAGRQAVRAGDRPQVAAHRVTDGDVAVERGRDEHVRRRVEDEHLPVLDQLADDPAAVEPMRHVPQQLPIARHIHTHTHIQYTSQNVPD